MLHKGVMTALITPFDQRGELDKKGLRKNVEEQLKSNIDGLLALGTTGEGSTLKKEEEICIIEIILEEAKGKVPIFINAGDNATERTVAKVKMAEEMGADGALVITPYYNRPTQRGLITHFETVAKASSLPLILYHHPGRTGVSFTIETLSALANIDSIVGIKEASGNVHFAAKVLHELKSDFLLFCGEDPLTLPLLSLGASGVISVISNLFPFEFVSLVHAALKGDMETARKKHGELFPFVEASMQETNPIPIKAMMREMGKAAGECRLPLTPPSQETLRLLRSLLNTRLTQKQEANQ